MWLFLILFLVLVAAGSLALAMMIAVRLLRALQRILDPTATAEVRFFSSQYFADQSTLAPLSPMFLSFSSAQKTAVMVAGLAFHLLFWAQVQGVNLLLWYIGCAGFYSGIVLTSANRVPLGQWRWAACSRLAAWFCTARESRN
jgi:hypothetical protein